MCWGGIYDLWTILSGSLKCTVIQILLSASFCTFVFYFFTLNAPHVRCAYVLSYMYLPDRRLIRSLTAMEKDRLTRNDRRLTDRRNDSGIGAKRGVSGTLRSGRKKFFTANIMYRLKYTYICIFIIWLYLWISGFAFFNRKGRTSFFHLCHTTQDMFYFGWSQIGANLFFIWFFFFLYILTNFSMS